MSRPLQPIPKIWARLNRRERTMVEQHRSPLQVQRTLNAMPYNDEKRGATQRSFRSALAKKRAHCLEAALIAAAMLEHRGYPPLLLDITSVDLLDHVILVFEHDGRWGSIARSRDPGLHGRRPVFRNLEALVRSYTLPYIDFTGRITGYGLLDLRRLPYQLDWRFSSRNVWGIVDALNDNRHARIKTSDREYERWAARYRAYKRRHPEGKPTYYPNKKTWLAWPRP